MVDYDMTMTFSLHDSIGPDGAFDQIDNGSCSSPVGTIPKDDMHILRDKLQIPGTDGLIKRPRIDSLLTKSVSGFPATLVSGRAGTGKTALAASFAANFGNVVWYSVESSDVAWPAFSRYFSACLPGKTEKELDGANTPERLPSQAEIAGFLVRHASRIYPANGQERLLIVLDDLHHIFDAVWFDDFINLLLYSLPSETHLLLLCRSKPPNPLWRLRSKQMLNVIDEKVIAFNSSETEALFDSLSLSRSSAEHAHKQSFGRVRKLLQLA